MEILRTKSLSIGYGEKVIVSDINATLDAGDMVALIGPNGAGKSTLFKTLSSRIKPVEGTIELMGKDLTAYSPNEKAKLLGIVLTERPDDMFISVYDIVASGRYPYSGLFGKLNEKDETIIKESLEIIGISKLIDRRFHTLSDGEKQKVMIAKSIAQSTPVIMLDEPTAFLDYPSKIELLGILKSLAKEKGKAILFSSHDMELTLRHTDKLWIIAHGMPFMAGNNLEMMENGILKKYLGLKNEEHEFLFNKIM